MRQNSTIRYYLVPRKVNWGRWCVSVCGGSDNDRNRELWRGLERAIPQCSLFPLSLLCVYPLPLHYCQRVLCKLLIITGLWLCTVDLNFNKYFILDSIRFYDDSNCTTSSSFCSTWKPDKEALAPLAAWITWNWAKNKSAI